MTTGPAPDAAADGRLVLDRPDDDGVARLAALATTLLGAVQDQRRPQHTDRISAVIDRVGRPA